MNIKALASQTGASTHAIRHYEGLGLIRAKRSLGNYRIFAESVVNEVVFILTCRNCGFSLREIASFLPSYRNGRFTAADILRELGERVLMIDKVIEEQQERKRCILKQVAHLKRQGERSLRPAKQA
jgi:DNA-binding transcriptional MerR regulator